MPAARAASAREAPSSTRARASIRREAAVSRHRLASRRSSTAPSSFRVIATVMAPPPIGHTADQPRQTPRGSGRDDASAIRAVGIRACSRDCRKIGGAAPRGVFSGSFPRRGRGDVAWIVRLVSTGAEGEERSTDVLRIARPDDLADLSSLGLTLGESKRLLAGLQREIVAAQARVHAARRPACRSCGTTCRLKDYRRREIATLFGRVTVRLPRFRCAGCATSATGVEWPPHVRSTPELDRLRAQLSALLTYRTAAALLGQIFPVDAGQDPETLHRHTFKIAQTLAMTSAAEAPVSVDAKAIVVTLDSTFIRSCEDGGRHLEVRIGNVETESGGRQVFGAVAKVNTDIGALIRRALDAVGRTGDTALTAFTDGCPGLRRILVDAGVTAPPMLDWFHIAMRLQHLKQVAGVLSDEDPTRGEVKAMIITQVERLCWRIWNGKAKDAQISIDRIHALLPSFESEPARKLRRALDAVDRYLRSQSTHLVDYAERHRAGQRVGTALTEGTANFLVNRRMAKA